MRKLAICAQNAIVGQQEAVEATVVDGKRRSSGSDGCEGAIFKGRGREHPIEDPERGEGGKDEKSVDARKELLMDLEQKT